MKKNIRRSGYQVIRVFSSLVFLFLGLLALANVSQAEEFLTYDKEIVVTASRMPQLISESPTSITVITEEEIKASGATSVAEALRQVSSVDIKSVGYLGGETTVRLRGCTSDQVLLLIDGRRINSPQGAWNEFDTVPLASVEKIEIVRGPVSALYGTDAVGGVVNVITKKGLPPQTTATLGLESYNTRKYSLGQVLGNKQLNASWLVDVAQTDGPRANSDYNGQNYRGELNWGAADNINVRLLAAYFQAMKGVPNALTSPSLTDRLTDKKTELDLSGNLGRINVRGFQNYFNRLFSSISVSQHKNWTEGLDIGFKLPFLSSGFEWRRDRIESNVNGSHATYNLALFLHDEISLSRAVKFTFGVRGDQHSVFGEVLSPRVGLVYQPRVGTTLKSSWGESFRAPTFDDLYCPTTSWAAGNPNLVPEKAQTFDLGVEQNLSASTLIGVSWFTSSVKDMINWAPGTGGLWQPSNVDKAQLQGTELEVKRQFTSALSGFINYTNLRAIDANTNNELIYKPKSKLNLGVRFDNKKVQTFFTLRHVDPQFTDPANTDILASYTVADVGLTLLPFEFKINNCFDADYQESKGYPMPRRTFSLGIQQSW